MLLWNPHQEAPHERFNFETRISETLTRMQSLENHVIASILQRHDVKKPSVILRSNPQSNGILAHRKRPKNSGDETRPAKRFAITHLDVTAIRFQRARQDWGIHLKRYCVGE